MNTLTHALLPAIVAGLCNKSYAAPVKRKKLFTGREILLIALLGAAPDILNPHITLAARYTSWSHSIAVLLPLSMLLVLCSGLFRKLRPRLIPWLLGAYALHLACDAITGGIAWAYPFSSHIIGKTYINFIYWIPIDLTFSIVAYFLFRAFPNYMDSRERHAKH
ncbi:hypothetical protein Rhal01_01139 [Rubritalea halochordaticola]|uniref:Metal-dependent hydrolase n=1 Tax=Rubritalea halochordaticola TaxID=714537 RepID=A0ABP9UX46_9BACT